jgi:hypothetical protein
VALRPHLSMGLPLSADIQLMAHNMPLHTPFIVSIGSRSAWVNGKVVPIREKREDAADTLLDEPYGGGRW